MITILLCIIAGSFLGYQIGSGLLEYYELANEKGFLVEPQLKIIDDKNTPKIPLSSIFIVRKKKEVIFSNVFLFVSLLIYIATQILTKSEIEILFPFVALLICLFLYLYYFITKVRIKTSLYANNEFEVREFLSFLYREVNKINSNSDSQKLFDEKFIKFVVFQKIFDLIKQIKKKPIIES